MSHPWFSSLALVDNHSGASLLRYHRLRNPPIDDDGWRPSRRDTPSTPSVSHVSPLCRSICYRATYNSTSSVQLSTRSSQLNSQCQVPLRNVVRVQGRVDRASTRRFRNRRRATRSTNHRRLMTTSLLAHTRRLSTSVVLVANTLMWWRCLSSSTCRCTSSIRNGWKSAGKSTCQRSPTSTPVGTNRHVCFRQAHSRS